MAENSSIMAGSPASFENPAPAKIRARATRGNQVRAVTQRDRVAGVVVSETVMPGSSGVLWGW
jgi:hypothetical protein